VKKTILIVENDGPFRKIERELLEDSGYNVLDTDNANEGISLAMEHIPDLILMDIRLPDKKRGIGAAKTLRKNDETQHIPIIFVTAYKKWVHSKEITNIPKSECITKPFRLDDFLGKIKKYLGD